LSWGEGEGEREDAGGKGASQSRVSMDICLVEMGADSRAGHHGAQQEQKKKSIPHVEFCLSCLDYM
jgi:hypothetical protein